MSPSHFSVHSPLDSVDQCNDDAERVSARCSDPLDSLGADRNLDLLSEDQRSRKGWMGGSYLPGRDSVHGCRLRGRLDILLALPKKTNGTVLSKKWMK